MTRAVAGASFPAWAFPPLHELPHDFLAFLCIHGTMRDPVVVLIFGFVFLSLNSSLLLRDCVNSLKNTGSMSIVGVGTK